MIVLDTDVISELMKESPDTAVWQWLHDNLGEELYTTAITAAEIHNGIEQLPAGRLRKQVREAAGGIFALVQDEVLSFTAEEVCSTEAVTPSASRETPRIEAAICVMDVVT